MPTAASPELATPKHEKKQKKDKSAKSEKKRAREEDAAVTDGERRHKKSKSVSADSIALSQENASSQDVRAEKKKKKKKEKKDEHDDGIKVEAANVAKPEKSKTKKTKRVETEEATQKVEETELNDTEPTSEKKDKKRRKKQAEVTGEVPADAETPTESKTDAQLTTLEDPDAMDIDQPSSAKSKSAKVYQPPDTPANPHFPFFKQTVSLYEALYPNGWAQPVTSCQYQHLQHLQNKYVPSLRGVLLDYKNVALGPEPGRDGAATDDETPATVASQKEFAVGFGWITADVELFVPSREAWMEGSVNLQTEGHIGVVCFGKFNASVEAKRLPPSWRWLSNEAPEAQGLEETASVFTADDNGVPRQLHSTGFWVDQNGDRIKGTIRFRIRNFDAGISGETSYLSLEGTMLDADAEKKLVAEEALEAKTRRAKKGRRRTERRRAPEFSMTRFMDMEAEGEPQVGEAVQQP